VHPTDCGTLNRTKINHKGDIFLRMSIARARTLTIKFLVGMAVATSILLICSPSVVAQEITRFDVYGGYSYLRFDGRPIGFASNPNMNGWNAGGAVNFGDSFSVVVDASGDYGSQVRAYNFMVGPQYSWRFQKSRLFVQGLFGKAQNTVDITQPTRNGFESVGRSVAAGGGYDWDLSPRFSIRVLQVDYLNTHTFGVSQNDIRASAGLVVHLGHRGKKPRL
jgi:hypothetical protein